VNNKHIWTDSPAPLPNTDKRAAARKDISIPARLTWKDQRGTTRFVSGVTRNISEYGVYLECQTPVSIPMFRLVQFQLERAVRLSDDLPAALRSGRVLSAVYRVSPRTTTGRPHCLALRLMVDPKRRVVCELPESQLTMPQVAEATA